MIFIVPTNWTTATYAASLRDELADMGTFEIVLSFGEYRLIRDCAPNCIIFRYRKHPAATTGVFVGEYNGERADLESVLAGAAATVAKAADAPDDHEEAEERWRRLRCRRCAREKLGSSRGRPRGEGWGRWRPPAPAGPSATCAMWQSAWSAAAMAHICLMRQPPLRLPPRRRI